MIYRHTCKTALSLKTVTCRLFHGDGDVTSLKMGRHEVIGFTLWTFTPKKEQLIPTE
jgi:hypothetical protein